jgi:pyruvate dehydrogenase E1 component alpha subunit
MSIREISYNMQKNSENVDIPSTTLRDMYVTMLKIRRFEDKVAEGCLEKKVICPAHLYTGQEAVATGVCANMNKEDYAFGTHRGHGLYIAKGGDLNTLMAEIYGRKTGCSDGKGGSMHVVAPEVGILGTTSIVGGVLPLAVGTALASVMREENRISVSFFGDGATDEGVFHECLNFASLKKLPVIFVCENNFYSSHLHISFRQTHENIARFAEVHEMLGIQADGNDVVEVYKAAHEAVEHTRKGNGPVLMEFKVNRWRGHVGPNWDEDVGLRSKEQIDEWKRNCPINEYEDFLMKKKILSESEIERISADVDKAIEEAIRFAEESPYPDPTEVTEDVYKC